MKTIEDYVEAEMTLKYAKSDFLKELCDVLDIDKHHIKSVDLITFQRDNCFVYQIAIELIGTNRFSSEDVAKIKGLSVVTPNRLEIEYSEITI